MTRKTKYQSVAFAVLLAAALSAAYVNHRVTQARIEQEHLEHISKMGTNKERTDVAQPESTQPNSKAVFFEGFSDEDCDNAPDIYNDRLDDYLDDPEDEIRFPPEIFDASDD